jgi:hypothetical protein
MPKQGAKHSRTPWRRVCGHSAVDGQPCKFESRATNGGYAALRAHEQNKSLHGASTAKQIANRDVRAHMGILLFGNEIL